MGADTRWASNHFAYQMPLFPYPSATQSNSMDEILLDALPPHQLAPSPTDHDAAMRVLWHQNHQRLLAQGLGGC